MKRKASKQEKEVVGDLGSLVAWDKKLAKNRAFHLHFAMYVGSIAFDDLDINIVEDGHTGREHIIRDDSTESEAISRLERWLGRLPEDYEEPEAWIDIANSECHLNISNDESSSRVVAFKIGKAIQRKIDRENWKSGESKSSKKTKVRAKAGRDAELLGMRQSGMSYAEIVAKWNTTPGRKTISQEIARTAVAREKARIVEVKETE